MNGPRGGNGTGGNGADSYQKGGNQGDGTGNGDKGVNGGDPNGTRYDGPRRVGARIYNLQGKTFQDDITLNGKIILDVLVNAKGEYVSSTFYPKGSNITDAKHLRIAQRRAAELDYGKYSEGSRQLLTIVFKVN